LNWIKKNKVWLICAAVVIIVAAVGYLYVSHVKTQQGAATVVSYPDTTKPAVLEKTLSVTEQESDEIAGKIADAQSGSIKPAATYYITAPTLAQAATKTATAINNRDTTLPKAATETSDRTVVTANTDQQKVDVYKINLRNNHKILAGATVIDSKYYETVGYQAGRVTALAQLQGTTVKGGTVLYTVKQW